MQFRLTMTWKFHNWYQYVRYQPVILLIWHVVVLSDRDLFVSSHLLFSKSVCCYLILPKLGSFYSHLLFFKSVCTASSIVVECWLRVGEVPGSIPSQGPRHTKDVIKIVVVPLFNNIKKGNTGSFWRIKIGQKM